jgi:hypothetical protein
MLRSIKQSYGNKLGASDGEIGHIKDFYFDDRNWAIRYLVADTGTWLPGRQVLISPHSLAGLDVSGKVVRVNLTRQQIENSPPIESHKPVSRQFEEKYHKYYGWPSYWTGTAADMIGPQPEREVFLRSAQAVNGYLLQMGEETIGHICDFMMDAKSWTIRQLVVKTGHRLTGKEMTIPTNQVDRVSHEESIVFAHSSAETGEQSAASQLAPAGAAD